MACLGAAYWGAVDLDHLWFFSAHKSLVLVYVAAIRSTISAAAIKPVQYTLATEADGASKACWSYAGTRQICLAVTRKS